MAVLWLKKSTMNVVWVKRVVVLLSYTEDKRKDYVRMSGIADTADETEARSKHFCSSHLESRVALNRIDTKTREST